MGGCKIPGSWGRPGSPPIDEGTPCLWATNPPRILEGGPLVVDGTLLEETIHTLFRLTICEALRRGAKDRDLSQLRMRYLWSRQTSGRIQDDLSRELDEGWTESVIAAEKGSFDAIVQDEMQRIAPDDDADSPVKDSDDYRYRIRPLYYSFGYTHPADFLEDQIPYSLFGEPRLKTMVHRKLASKLDQLPDVLNKWALGLVDKTKKEVHGVNGLQIRTVKGKNVLSNHAFGLAVDINALSNPHVVGKAVIAVFNQVAARSGCPFDFGKPVLTKGERGHDTYTADDIMEIHNRARPASDAVKAWLQENLPRYKRLMEQVKAAEKDLGLKSSASLPLSTRFQAAEAARNRIQKQAELKNPNKVCETTASDAPETVALEKINAAFTDITQDPELQRIQVLYENFDTAYIETWVKQGVMTMPLYVAIALVGVIDLQWGEQYEGSKDAMHFELVLKKNKPVFAPEEPLESGEKPRTLERLMESSFKSKVQRLHLHLPEILSKRNRQSVDIHDR